MRDILMFNMYFPFSSFIYIFIVKTCTKNESCEQQKLLKKTQHDLFIYFIYLFIFIELIMDNPHPMFKREICDTTNSENLLRLKLFN